MATYYVDTVDGNDGNLGTSEGSGNAWATIGKAMSTVIAGDHVYIKASGTYDEELAVSVAGTASSSGQIIFEGYTTTPGDKGIVTWTNTGTTYILTFLGTNNFYVMRNIDFNGGPSYGVGPNTADEIGFYNCKFTNNGNTGAILDNGCIFSHCDFIGNSGIGADCDNSANYVACRFLNNTSGIAAVGFNLGVFYKCVVAGNGPGGGLVTAQGSVGGIFGCTIVGDSSSGQKAYSSTGSYVFAADNLVKDVPIAFTRSSGARAHGVVVTDNVLDNCTTLTSPVYSWVDYMENVTDGTAAFTDEAGDDYTIQETSDAIDNGVMPGALS